MPDFNKFIVAIVGQDTVDQLKSCEQSPKYHAEGSVYNHIELVFNECVPYNNTDLLVCAVFHDLGKLDTASVVLDKEGKERIHHFNHELHVDKYIEMFKDFKYEDMFQTIQGFMINWEKVKYICENHMRCHKYINGEMSNLNKRKAFENNPYFEELVFFALADNLGRRSL